MQIITNDDIYNGLNECLMKINYLLNISLNDPNPMRINEQKNKLHDIIIKFKENLSNYITYINIGINKKENKIEICPSTDKIENDIYNDLNSIEKKFDKNKQVDYIKLIKELITNNNYTNCIKLLELLVRLEVTNDKNKQNSYIISIEKLITKENYNDKIKLLELLGKLEENTDNKTEQIKYIKSIKELITNNNHKNTIQLLELVREIEFNNDDNIQIYYINLIEKLITDDNHIDKSQLLYLLKQLKVNNYDYDNTIIYHNDDLIGEKNKTKNIKHLIYLYNELINKYKSKKQLIELIKNTK